RVDHQVKIRGHRIELSEIESVLMGHPGVREAVVNARADRAGGPGLVAYLVPCETGAISGAELRQYLQERLPEYMVPAHLIFLEALPLSPNGKIDRKALPAPDRRRPELGQAYRAPGTELERFLADLWRDILHLDRVGIHDQFFELGGDSLLGAALINRI